MTLLHQAAQKAVEAHPCTQKLTGNAALDVLRAAMIDAEIEHDDRINLIGFFCNRWNEAIAALQQQPDPVANPSEKHFRERIDTYADRHPTRLVRQLATLLREQWRSPALQQQEVPREPVARWLGDLLTKMPTLDPLWSADVKLGWYRCFDSLRALAASPSTTQQQEAGNEPDAMEAHRPNGLAWAVSCWQAEVMNRPLVNVHRRTLDDTWRQVIRYFGGDPDELLGPNHDTLHMRAQEERAWKP